MVRMKAVQASKPGGEWELVEREVPEPGAGQARIKVETCGICHSDMLVKDGLWPGLQYPRVPGHEIAGRIDEVGSNVTSWKKGQHVGVGWFGGHCGQCRAVTAQAAPPFNCRVCGSADVMFSAGDELLVEAIELVDGTVVEHAMSADEELIHHHLHRHLNADGDATDHSEAKSYSRVNGTQQS